MLNSEYIDTRSQRNESGPNIDIDPLVNASPDNLPGTYNIALLAYVTGANIYQRWGAQLIDTNGNVTVLFSNTGINNSVGITVGTNLTFEQLMQTFGQKALKIVFNDLQSQSTVQFEDYYPFTGSYYGIDPMFRVIMTSSFIPGASITSDYQYGTKTAFGGTATTFSTRVRITRTGGSDLTLNASVYALLQNYINQSDNDNITDWCYLQRLTTMTGPLVDVQLSKQTIGSIQQAYGVGWQYNNIPSDHELRFKATDTYGTILQSEFSTINVSAHLAEAFYMTNEFHVLAASVPVQLATENASLTLRYITTMNINATGKPAWISNSTQRQYYMNIICTEVSVPGVGLNDFGFQIRVQNKSNQQTSFYRKASRLNAGSSYPLYSSGYGTGDSTSFTHDAMLEAASQLNTTYIQMCGWLQNDQQSWPTPQSVFKPMILQPSTFLDLIQRCIIVPLQWETSQTYYVPVSGNLGKPTHYVGFKLQMKLIPPANPNIIVPQDTAIIVQQEKAIQSGQEEIYNELRQKRFIIANQTWLNKNSSEYKLIYDTVEKIIFSLDQLRKEKPKFQFDLPELKLRSEDPNGHLKILELMDKSLVYKGGKDLKHIYGPINTLKTLNRYDDRQEREIFRTYNALKDMQRKDITPEEIIDKYFTDKVSTSIMFGNLSGAFKTNRIYQQHVFGKDPPRKPIQPQGNYREGYLYQQYGSQENFDYLQEQLSKYNIEREDILQKIGRKDLNISVRTPIIEFEKYSNRLTEIDGYLADIYEALNQYKYAAQIEEKSRSSYWDNSLSYQALNVLAGTKLAPVYQVARSVEFAKPAAAAALSLILQNATVESITNSTKIFQQFMSKVGLSSLSFGKTMSAFLSSGIAQGTFMTAEIYNALAYMHTSQEQQGIENAIYNYSILSPYDKTSANQFNAALFASVVRQSIPTAVYPLTFGETQLFQQVRNSVLEGASQLVGPTVSQVYDSLVSYIPETIKDIVSQIPAPQFIKEILNEGEHLVDTIKDPFIWVDMSHVTQQGLLKIFAATLNLVAGTMEGWSIKAITDQHQTTTAEGRSRVTHAYSDFVSRLPVHIDLDNRLTVKVIEKSFSNMFKRCMRQQYILGNLHGYVQFKIFKSIVHPEDHQEISLQNDVLKFTNKKQLYDAKHVLTQGKQSETSLELFTSHADSVSNYIERLTSSIGSFHSAFTGGFYVRDRQRSAYQLPQARFVEPATTPYREEKIAQKKARTKQIQQIKNPVRNQLGRLKQREKSELDQNQQFNYAKRKLR